MFKNHPKGLLAAALANMGERFGFYTMMAILSLFLMAKFGLTGGQAGLIYSIFYFSIYVLSFVGGLIADRTKNFKGTILIGLIMMAVGYFLIAIPTGTPVPQNQFAIFLAMTCFGLLVIAFGNGLFKGNLQALVGQMYDNPKYSNMRDAGFQWFYMFINVGAIFAPLAAVGVRNWWVNSHGFKYNPDLPALCHQQLNGSLQGDAMMRFQDLSAQVGCTTTDLSTFASDYLNVFATGFHYAFAVAIFAMAISLVIYLANKKKFPNPSDKEKAVGVQADEMSVAEIRQRMYALFAVFAVVIFFWFSFHQNGLTLTFFARDYTLLRIDSFEITAELFQSMNPFFVVFLTPIVMAFFGW
ncbi:MAG: MFS transporter, partial [Bacteroidales bacterium]|nr:MFS transporter [Bacteroidales bacterium]